MEEVMNSTHHRRHGENQSSRRLALMNTDKTLIELRMARRNNISKIPITAACSFALLALMAVACPPPIFPTYKVPASFRVVLKSQSQPMAGVNLNLYREEGAANLRRHLLL